MRSFHALSLAMLAALAPAPAFAQVAVADSGDTAWMMVCVLLVLLAAIPGLALRFAGLVSARNGLSVMAQLLGVAATASLAWAVIGYSLAYAPGNGWLGGAANAFLANLGALREGLTVPESVFALFQMSLALLAAGIIVGAVLERVRFGWLLLFAPLWVLMVYAPVTRWLWGGGWLAALGTLDYAGALVVHVSAGASALAAALMIGRRSPGAELSQHAPILSLAGVALIWLGWFGATGGWALGASDEAAAAMLNTQFAASAGALGWAVMERLRSGRIAATGLGSGALAGLVAVSAAAGLVGPAGAMAIGAIAGVITQAIASLVARSGIDDSAQIFAVHGVGGMLGAVLLVPFTLPLLGGVGFEDGVSLTGLLVAQFVGIGVVALWSALVTAIIGFGLSMVIPLRVTADVEQEGLDVGHHGQPGWNFR